MYLSRRKQTRASRRMQANDCKPAAASKRTQVNASNECEHANASKPMQASESKRAIVCYHASASKRLPASDCKQTLASKRKQTS